MSEEKAAEKVLVKLLYLGVNDTPKDADIAHKWYVLTDIENDGEPLKLDGDRIQFYGTKKKKFSHNIVSAQPGAIYQFEKSEKGVFSSTAAYVGRWKNTDDLAKWQAEHHAIMRTIELRELAAKQNKERIDWELLEPIQEAYNKRLNYKQQEMLLAQVIRFITTYPKKAK